MWWIQASKRSLCPSKERATKCTHTAITKPKHYQFSKFDSYEKFVRQICEDPELHSKFWDLPGVNSLKYKEGYADVPTVYIGGWYDSYARGTIDQWATFSQFKNSPQFLIMGPWVINKCPLCFSKFLFIFCVCFYCWCNLFYCCIFFVVAGGLCIILVCGDVVWFVIRFCFLLPFSDSWNC